MLKHDLFTVMVTLFPGNPNGISYPHPHEDYILQGGTHDSQLSIRIDYVHSLIAAGQWPGHSQQALLLRTSFSYFSNSTFLYAAWSSHNSAACTFKGLSLFGSEIIKRYHVETEVLRRYTGTYIISISLVY